jgi:predicted DNA-binding antitoxin AbrB/MazE fold protein
MSQVEAIFQGGVFRPTGAVNLPENQRVVLSFEPAKKLSMVEWLEQSRQHHEAILARRGPLGPLPDSTPLIREDRDR